MKIVDLHPEELLDKDARGELSESERARLDAHLERCATCRFEREVRADFAEELAEERELGPQEIVELALGHAPRAPAAPIARSDVRELRDVDVDVDADDAMPMTPRRRRRRSVRLPLLIAAALLVGGAAGAGAGIRTWSRLSTGEDPTVTVTAHAHDPAPPELLPKRVAPPAPTPTELEVSAPETPPEAPPPLPVIVPVRTVPVIAPMPSPAPSSIDVAPSPPAGPAALFDAAAEARRRGDHGRALDLHRELVARYPQSREARVSHATIGQLLLDRGDASGALASFDAYRAGGAGPLDEPVMVGRATALDRLGRFEDARAAWSLLLATFPQTPYAHHARARLEGTSTR